MLLVSSSPSAPERDRQGEGGRAGNALALIPIRDKAGFRQHEPPRRGILPACGRLIDLRPRMTEWQVGASYCLPSAPFPRSP